MGSSGYVLYDKNTKNGFLCYNRSGQVMNEDLISDMPKKDLATLSMSDIFLKVNE